MFSRTVEGQTYTFGVSGKLWKNGLVMYDHQTATLWSGVTGEALEGPLVGKWLTIRAAIPQVRWRDWQAAYPQSQVLTVQGVQEEPEDRYASYHASGQTGLVPPEHAKTHLPPKALVMGIHLGDQAQAYPVRLLMQTPIVTDQVAGMDLVVYREAASEASAVYERRGERPVVVVQAGTPVDPSGGYHDGEHLGYCHGHCGRRFTPGDDAPPRAAYHNLLVRLGGFLSPHDALPGAVRR